MIQLTPLEGLVVKHFTDVQQKRRWYVWLGLGLINMLGGAAYGYYLEICSGNLAGTKLWLQDWRFNVSRNASDQIASILIGMFRASFQEETGRFPDDAISTLISVGARDVQSEYLASIEEG